MRSVPCLTLMLLVTGCTAATMESISEPAFCAGTRELRDDHVRELRRDDTPDGVVLTGARLVRALDDGCAAAGAK